MPTRLDLGHQLSIRAMIYVAGRPMPFFWPMRGFIHHNPLHGLEHLPFAEALYRGEQLFRGRAFLPRGEYQAYLAAGEIDRSQLESEVATFCARDRALSADSADMSDDLAGIDRAAWLMTLLTELPQRVTGEPLCLDYEALRRALAGEEIDREHDADPLPSSGFTPEALVATLQAQLGGERPVYEAVDALFGTQLGRELDELLIKICLDFFDEGQSVWGMPSRNKGLFAAWRDLALRTIWPSYRSRLIKELLQRSESPEAIIAHVMAQLRIPESHWVGYFSRELAHLHGWTGFVRWRASAKRYYWRERHPADLVDLLAVRLTLAWALLGEQKRRGRPSDAAAITQFIAEQPEESYLRHQLYSGNALPLFAQELEERLSGGGAARIEPLFRDYIRGQRRHNATQQAARLSALAARVDATGALKALSAQQLGRLLQELQTFEQGEGMLWLRAMEAHAIGRVLAGVTPPAANGGERRPFAQALFCIDTRSERIRRQLEAVGSYQTFGIAGFFGVPVSFIELDKGSEQHLCPVLLTPKNLVLEMTTAAATGPAALTTLEKVIHELKESVVTPFVTVEAIGPLFGLDMVGKSVAPRRYQRWRRQLHRHKPPTHLLLDKLSEEQADSIIRAAQRSVIVKAIESELKRRPESLTDDLIRALREAALGPDRADAPDDAIELAQQWCDQLGLEDQGRVFIQRLRDLYLINRAFARRQRERLGRVGFTLDEQVGFVHQALKAIGLSDNFSRLVLLVGHGSHSENNPYESALDCGACGGAHGLVSARVLAQMANKPAVRARLGESGVVIPEETWFLPAFHNTTTDEITLADLERLPPSHLVYLDRLRSGLAAAARLCAHERIPSLNGDAAAVDPTSAFLTAQRNASDWSQVRPEWGLSGNAYFIIGRRTLTQSLNLEGRSFLHSYDYRLDPKLRLLENILTGPLVVGQWINMEHYFSTVDNERFGSGSKAYHNIAGRFGVMSGNLSDLRTGLPAQTVLNRGRPYHQPMRLITLIEAPFDQARRAIEAVVAVKQLVRNGWIRLLVLDPESQQLSLYNDKWEARPFTEGVPVQTFDE